MTGLIYRTSLPPAPSPTTRPGDPAQDGRPLAVSAAVAGVAAPLVVLAGCMVVALAGWFASDGGSHGTTKDALRIGSLAWLLAHGSHLAVGTMHVTAAPLGLTLLSGYVAFRCGRWAGATSVVPDGRTLGLGTVVMAGVYGVVGVLTAVLAASHQLQPQLLEAFAGGFMVAATGGGFGMAVGSGLFRGWVEQAPDHLVAAGRTAVGAVLLVYCASAVLVAASLAVHFAGAASVLSQLHVDVSGGLLEVVVCAAITPNLVLLGSSYLLGPGFAIGTGTLVAPSQVLLGPLPAVPVLAALPSPGVAPAWVTALVAVPVFLAAVAAAVAQRSYPVRGYEVAAARGFCGGALGGLLLTVAIAFAGGSIGPGRMTHTGAVLSDVLVCSVVSLAIGGAIGAVGMTWWQRRRRSSPQRTAATDQPAP